MLFRSDHTVITFDQCGTGKSAARSKDYANKRLCDDAAALLDHLGLGPAVVLGHSNGGRVSQRLGLVDRPGGRRAHVTVTPRTGGVAIALKSRNKNIRIAAADPMGAAIYSWIKTGKLESHGTSITEGIGQGRVTANLEGAPFDDAYQIPDEEALPIVFDLLEHEGLCMGGSTGINVAAAMRMAKDMGPGHTIVTVLCDYGNRYQSKLFNPDFMRSKNLPVPEWIEKTTDIAVPFVTPLEFAGGDVLTVSATCSGLGDAAAASCAPAVLVSAVLTD